MLFIFCNYVRSKIIAYWNDAKMISNSTEMLANYNVRVCLVWYYLITLKYVFLDTIQVLNFIFMRSSVYITKLIIGAYKVDSG